MQYPCVPTFRVLATDACWSSHPMNALASLIWVVALSDCASGINCGMGVAAPLSAVGAFFVR